VTQVWLHVSSEREDLLPLASVTKIVFGTSNDLRHIAIRGLMRIIFTRSKLLAGCQWLTPVILSTWEAELSQGSQLEVSLGKKKFSRPPSQPSQPITGCGGEYLSSQRW
jgi:hypothetical protein